MYITNSKRQFLKFFIIRIEMTTMNELVVLHESRDNDDDGNNNLTTLELKFLCKELCK